MSTFGSTITPYTSWLNITRDTRVYDHNRLVNDATQQTYFLHEMIKGKPEGVIVRGGKEITEPVMLNDLGSYSSFTPGQMRNPTRQPFIYNTKYGYRFTEAHFTWTEEEERFNEGDQFAAYKRFTNSWRQALHTTIWNGMEANLWAVPHAADMEFGATSSNTAAVPGKVNSIPMFVTEDGLVPPANGGTFTGIGGLSPATYENWQSQASTYDASTLNDEQSGLFAAFEEMMLKLDFKTVPGFAKYQESDSLRKLKIVTNRDGRKVYSNRLRSSNDSTRAGPQDPAYGMPVFNGIPLVYARSLDTALLEQTTLGTLDNAAYTAGRPRYFFLNLDYLFPVFDSTRKMHEKAPINGGALQHDAWTVYVVNYWNLICTSRRRQGIIRPA